MDKDLDFLVTGNLKRKLLEPEVMDNLDIRKEVEEMIFYYNQQYIRARKIDKLGAVTGIQEFIDNEISDLPPDLKSTIACQKGCSYCCHMPVTLSEDEAALIGHYCKKNGIQINKKYLKKQLRIPEASIHSSDISACVFLKNRLCSIYPVRPYNCRKYLVYNTPKFCNPKRYEKAKVETYFSFNIEAATSAAFFGKVGRLPELMLPYSK